MKYFTVIFLLSLSIAAGVKEDMQRIANDIQLELAKERLRVIKSDGDLTNLFNNIIRNHESMDRILKRHPEMIKNAKLKEPALTELKLKLINEDEDLRDVRESLIKLHRKLEEALAKHESIVKLKQRLASINSRLDRLK